MFLSRQKVCKLNDPLEFMLNNSLCKLRTRVNPSRLNRFSGSDIALCGSGTKMVLHSVFGHQTPDVSQVTAHVGFDRFGRTVGFKIGVPLVLYLRDRVEHLAQVDLALAEIVRIVLEMELTDALTANLPNLADDVEALVGRVADVVVNE